MVLQAVYNCNYFWDLWIFSY